jgi:hypothetical protein
LRRDDCTRALTALRHLCIGSDSIRWDHIKATKERLKYTLGVSQERIFRRPGRGSHGVGWTRRPAPDIKPCGQRGKDFAHGAQGSRLRGLAKTAFYDIFDAPWKTTAAFLSCM